jgi:hypothetical protein
MGKQPGSLPFIHLYIYIGDRGNARYDGSYFQDAPWHTIPWNSCEFPVYISKNKRGQKLCLNLLIKKIDVQLINGKLCENRYNKNRMDYSQSMQQTPVWTMIMRFLVSPFGQWQGKPLQQKTFHLISIVIMRKSGERMINTFLNTLFSTWEG